MSNARSAKFLDIKFPPKAKNWTGRVVKIWPGLKKSDFFGLFWQKSDHFWHFELKKSDYLTLVRLIWPHYLHCKLLDIKTNLKQHQKGKIKKELKKVKSFLNHMENDIIVIILITLISGFDKVNEINHNII